MAGHPVVGVDLHPVNAKLPATVGPFTLAGPADDWPEAMVYEADFGRFFYLHCPLEEAGIIARLMDMLRPVMVYPVSYTHLRAHET